MICWSYGGPSFCIAFYPSENLGKLTFWGFCLSSGSYRILHGQGKRSAFFAVLCKERHVSKCM